MIVGSVAFVVAVVWSLAKTENIGKKGVLD